MSKFVKLTFTATVIILTPSLAFAAGTNTGVEAGLYALGQDLGTILSGAGGYVILILSIIIGGITLMATGNWAKVAVSVGVAVFLGYGVQTLTSLGAVTAETDMLIQAPADGS